MAAAPGIFDESESRLRQRRDGLRTNSPELPEIEADHLAITFFTRSAPSSGRVPGEEIFYLDNFLGLVVCPQQREHLQIARIEDQDSLESGDFGVRFGDYRKRIYDSENPDILRVYLRKPFPLRGQWTFRYEQFRQDFQKAGGNKTLLRTDYKRLFREELPEVSQKTHRNF